MPARRKSVILFWLSGGLSHLDSWDPKPDAPQEIRGPFGVIPTSVPGVQFCEHLPLQAQIAHKLAIIRSVDCRASNHTPITMQAGNALARRTDDGKDGGGFPSMGSVAAKFRGANVAGMPAFVGLADSWAADVWGAGQLGSEFEPVKGSELAGRFALPEGLNAARLQDRGDLRRQFDRLRRDWDTSHTMERLDHYGQQAVQMVLSGRTQKAFQVDEEPDSLRIAYGRDSIGERTLLARRLVEASTESERDRVEFRLRSRFSNPVFRGANNKPHHGRCRGHHWNGTAASHKLSNHIDEVAQALMAVDRDARLGMRRQQLHLSKTTPWTHR